MDVGSTARLPAAPLGAPTPAAPPSPPSPVRTGEPDAFAPPPTAAAKEAAAKVASEAREELRRQITLDQDTHRMVYQGIDQLTGEIVFQLPDPRYLKAYVDQQKTAEQQQQDREKRQSSTSQVA